MNALAIVFWASVGLLLYTMVGYPLALWLLASIGAVARRSRPSPLRSPRSR